MKYLIVAIFFLLAGIVYADLSSVTNSSAYATQPDGTITEKVTLSRIMTVDEAKTLVRLLNEQKNNLTIEYNLRIAEIQGKIDALTPLAK